ncbi:MAG: protein kinase domain-containing protein, partial [Candidatus Xenobia bacterium]
KHGLYTVVTMVVQISDTTPRLARLFEQPPGVSESDLLVALDREAGLLRGISHPVLPRFDRVVEGEGGTWLFFEYASGTPLSHYLGSEETLPTPWILAWLAELLRGLQALHEARIAVGYLEPADVVVHDHRLLVADLGSLERMFPEHGIRLLKDHPFLNFVAPERRNSLRPVPGHDLFSAAGIAFWLATGRAPCCRGPQSAELHRAAVLEARPDLPAPVAELIGQGLAFHPGSRPPSAQSMLECLRPHLVELKGQKMPPVPEDTCTFKPVARDTRPLIEVEEARPAPPPLRVPEEVPVPEAEPVPAHHELLDEMGWHLRQNRVVQLVLLLVVLLPFWLLTHLTQPHLPPPPPLFTVSSGRLMLQVPHAPWVATSGVTAGAMVAAERQDVLLRFAHDSTLQVHADSALSCMAADQVVLHYGELEVKTAPADSLQIVLPATDKIEIGPKSQVQVDTRSGVRVAVAEGNATVVLRDGEHRVEAGKSVKLSLDGRKILP